MATTFDNINNPQQNPGYQSWQQAGGSVDNSGWRDYLTNTYKSPDQAGAGGQQSESFLQRLNRVRSGNWAPAQTQNPGPASNLQSPTSATSPVTSDGRLNPTPAAPLGPPPSLLGPNDWARYGVDPNTGYDLQNNRYNTNQPGTYLYHGDVGGNNVGWYAAQQPYNANQPGQAAQGAPTAADYFARQGLPQLPPNSTYYADDLGNTPFSAYRGFQFNVNTPQAYQAGLLSQFQGPQQQQMDASTGGLVQHVLENPLSLSPQVVNAMKEQQKETALQSQRQSQEQAAQLAAQRGLTLGSGQLETQQRRSNEALQSALTTGYRDIDIAKAQQDQADRIAAANLGNQFMSSQLGRAVQGYQTTLQGQEAQEQLRQAAAASGLSVGQLQLAIQQAQAGQNLAASSSQQQAQQLALQRAIAQSGLNQGAAQSGLQNFQTMFGALNAQRQNALGNRGLDIQHELGQAGIGLDYARLGETGREFDQNHQLDYLRYLLNQQQVGNQQGQFNDTLGFNYDQANLANQLALLRLSQGLG